MKVELLRHSVFYRKGAKGTILSNYDEDHYMIQLDNPTYSPDVIVPKKFVKKIT